MANKQEAQWWTYIDGRKDWSDYMRTLNVDPDELGWEISDIVAWANDHLDDGEITDSMLEWVIDQNS